MSQRRKGSRQCAALPFKEENGEIMVMLITSRETGRWILPKGWVEKHLTEAELAAKEAYEEAGIIGCVSPTPISRYHYTKRMQLESRDCTVNIYPLRVTDLLEDWKEAHQRRRAWFTLAQAAMQVDDGELVTVLLSLAAPQALSRYLTPHRKAECLAAH